MIAIEHQLNIVRSTSSLRGFIQNLLSKKISIQNFTYLVAIFSKIQLHIQLQFQYNWVNFTYHVIPSIYLNYNNQNLICYTKISSHTYSPTDNFGPPIPVPDWLIFCRGNLILNQKKK